MRDRLKLFLYELSHPDQPWLTRQMVDFLALWLRSSDIAVEWGSGASTRWFAVRVGRLTSIEESGEWYEKVSPQLADLDVDYRHVVAEADGYVAVIDTFPDESIDLCLVDGARRDECALRAVPKIRPGGLLLVDNANWYLPPPRSARSPSTRGPGQYAGARWREFARLVADWRCLWTSNGVTDTAAWIKPCPMQH